MIIFFFIAFIAALISGRIANLAMSGFIGLAVGTVFWTVLVRFGCDVFSLTSYFACVAVSIVGSNVLLNLRSP